MNVVQVLALALVVMAVALPAGVWFGIRIGREQSDAWWTRMLAGHPHGDRIVALAVTRKVTR